MHTKSKRRHGLAFVPCLLLLTAFPQAQPNTDPRTAPKPNSQIPDPERALIISVFFHSQTDVEVVDVQVANTRPRSYLGDPPLLLLELIDRDGNVIAQNNAMHPLWEFDRDIEGDESKQELPSGPGTFFVPLSGDLDSIRLSDQRLEEVLIEEPVRGVVTDYCDANPNSPICTDDDRDGVINVNDACNATQRGDGVDPSNGCSVAQLCPCDGPVDDDGSWRNHGQYLKCISDTARRFLRSGFVHDSNLGRIVSRAAASSCGKKSGDTRPEQFLDWLLRQR